MKKKTLMKVEKLKYEDVKNFLHCKHCIEQFLESPLHEVMTPRDYSLYELGLSDLEEDGNVRPVFILWCRRCGRQVWNSTILDK